MAMPICLRLFWHWVRAAASRTFCTAGRSRPIRMAMIAITTSSSISVKHRRRVGRKQVIHTSREERRTKKIQKNPGPLFGLGDKLSEGGLVDFVDLTNIIGNHAFAALTFLFENHDRHAGGPNARRPAGAQVLAVAPDERFAVARGNEQLVEVVGVDALA